MAATADVVLGLEEQNNVHEQRPAQRENSQYKNSIFSKSRLSVLILVIAVKMLMLFLVFGTLVASKVSITTMLIHLRSMTEFADDDTASMTTNKTDRVKEHKTAAVLYWQLLFILMIPNIITWGRALFNGVIGKSSSQPWPQLQAFIEVSDPDNSCQFMSI